MPANPGSLLQTTATAGPAELKITDTGLSGASVTFRVESTSDENALSFDARGPTRSYGMGDVSESVRGGIGTPDAHALALLLKRAGYAPSSGTIEDVVASAQARLADVVDVAQQIEKMRADHARIDVSARSNPYDCDERKAERYSILWGELDPLLDRLAEAVAALSASPQ